MVQGYIYRHWIINDEGVEKSYIGQTTDRPTRRWRDDGSGYLYSHGKKINNKFSNAINKYGWENFSHEIIGIVEGDTQEQLIRDLDEWEKYYIDKYNSFHNGYNSTTGGGNGQQSEESRKKISQAHKGKKLDEKHKAKIGRKHTKKVLCITTGEIFDSIKEAQEKYNTSHVSKCCRGLWNYSGKHPETGEKLIWKYYEKDE